MFALEVTFQDNVSKPDVLFVRRPIAHVGASEAAHVVLEDMRSLGYELRLARELERRFKITPIAVAQNSQIPTFLEGIYDGEASFDLGPVRIHVTALDLDLLLKDTEPSDRGAVRVLRQASAVPSPRFPALVVRGNPVIAVSFVADHPVYIGRSRQCALRLDYPEVSAKHARIGYESGEFWVEDLGSTNGTFVNGQQISGRVRALSEVPIVLGQDVTIVGVVDEGQLARASSSSATAPIAKKAAEVAKYPILISLSETARPARIVLTPGASINLGRDPSSDMWLGAPHISRKHCLVEMSKAGLITVTDQSTNGTRYDGGLLGKGDLFESTGQPVVLDFGAGVTVALCFNSGEEDMFSATGGSVETFIKSRDQQTSVKDTAQRRANRKTGTWFKNRPPRSIEQIRAAQTPLGQVKLVYEELTGQGRLIMALGIVGVVALLTIVVHLLLPVLR